MRNKIKHFIVDLDEVIDNYPYQSECYELAKKIKVDLCELVNKLEEIN